MINAKGAISVLKFELRRSMSASRIAVWMVLVLFPPAIVTLMFMGDYQIRDPLVFFGLPLLVLLPQVMCLLGLLLWASPIIHSELEGKSWIYVTARPGGRSALLLGKYLTSIVWTSSACWISLFFVVQIATQNGVTDEPVRMWLVYAALIAFASTGYGALYVLIGTVFHRRAMVVAVAYSVISEFTLTFVPAVINQLTFAYHFRCLLVDWMGWKVSEEVEPLFFGKGPIWQHLLMLIGISLTLIVAAAVVIHHREYITSEET